MRPTLLALILAAMAAGALAQAQTPGEPWPFGKAERFSRGRDLWNLGILGVKCWDADRDLPKAAAGGRRRSTSGPRNPKDSGPPRLRVIALYPDGPAASNGLHADDVIVGVGKKRFKDGFRQDMAAALLKAESGKNKGIVTLLVERKGKKKPARVKIPVPVAGKSAAHPRSGAHRQAVIDSALKWLAKRQREDGGFKETLSGSGGAVVMTSLAGLAWLAGGSDLQGGPHKDNVTGAFEFVTKTIHQPSRFGEAKPGEPSWDQSNWALVHAALFLGELHDRTGDPRVVSELQKIADRICANQVPSGGWAHGTGGKNALDYLELNIVTGLALYGLGMAQHAGCQVDNRVVLGAARYIKQSSSGGGVGYSTSPGQKGQGNIGRSAATWLGFLALGRAKAADTRKIKSYVARNVGDPQGGHASLMQHIFLAGLAAHALGKEAEKRLWAGIADDLTLARAPDGSFQPRPWRETLSMGSNSDVSFGEVWTTTTWTIILACKPVKNGRPGLPALLGKPTRRN